MEGVNGRVQLESLAAGQVLRGVVTDEAHSYRSDPYTTRERGCGLPARLLAEREAKRKLIAEHDPATSRPPDDRIPAAH